MGKTNARPKRAFKKDPIATKVAGVKKTKTKVVVTSLKKLTFLNKSQTEAVDAQFAELQQATADKAQALQVSSTAKASSQERHIQKTDLKEEKEPDIDMAVEELTKLVST